MNPNSELDRGRLLKSIETSRRQMRPFREMRSKMVRDYVGTYYGSGSTNVEERQEIIMNLMYQTAETYTMSLAANRPRVLVSSKHPQLSWFSHHFQMSLNNLIEEVHLEEVLRSAVLDAFFCLGVVKVYTADAGLVQLEGTDEWVDPGKPFAESISLDDFCFDMQATHWRKIRYALNKYRVPYEKIKNDPIYDPDVVKAISPSSDHLDNHTGEDPLRNMNKGDRHDDDLEPNVELMDVWLPREQLVVTMVAGKNLPPLSVVEWNGPENGPFHTLSLCTDVPDQIIPVSPAMNLKGMNDIINGLLRKQRRQAQRQKDIPFYQAGSEEDARRLGRASDGEWTRVDNPETVSVLKMGGVDQGNQSFGFQMRDLYDRMAGNLQMMAGLGPSSDTLGQDKLIHGAVSKREANMQYRVVDFAKNICQDMGWLLWNDMATNIENEYKVGTSTFRTHWTPEMREGDFLQYNFELEPYSMMYKSPSERLNNLTNFITQVLMPMQQNLQQSGGMIDIQELVEINAELLDMPRLKQIVKFEEPKGDRPGPTPEQPPQPQKVVRENIRRSVPTGGTQESRSNVMQQVLSGGQPNQQQVAQMGRSQAG